MTPLCIRHIPQCSQIPVWTPYPRADSDISCNASMYAEGLASASEGDGVLMTPIRAKGPIPNLESSNGCAVCVVVMSSLCYRSANIAMEIVACLNLFFTVSGTQSVWELLT